MANEIRLRRNNISGTITDNPLAQVSTTINSPGFVDLPTIAGTNSLILILDPLEVNGPAEIVLVTAHTAAATSVTVTRGAEGSSPRAHVQGTTWFHGPVTSDFEEVLTSSTRPTIPYTGESIFETDTARAQRYSGTAWQQDGLYFDPPACRVFNTANLSIPNNAFTDLTFNSERYDTDNMHNTGANTERITFNTAGLYVVTAGVRWQASAAGDRCIRFFLNAGFGTAIASWYISASTAINHEQFLTTTWKFGAGDFIHVGVFQTSGGALNAEVIGNYACEVSATWIGRGN